MQKRIVYIIFTLMFLSMYVQNALCKETQNEMQGHFKISFAPDAERSFRRSLFKCAGHENYVLDTLRCDQYAETILKIINDSSLYDVNALNDTIVILDDCYAHDNSDLFVITSRCITNKISLGEITEINSFPNEQSTIQRMVNDYIDVYCNSDSGQTSIVTELIIEHGNIVRAKSYQYPPLILYDVLGYGYASTVVSAYNWANDIIDDVLGIDAPIGWRSSPKKYRSISFEEITYGRKPTPLALRVPTPSLPDSIKVNMPSRKVNNIPLYK